MSNVIIIKIICNIIEYLIMLKCFEIIVVLTTQTNIHH